MENILILGAKSDIAKAITMKYAEKGYGIYLAGRKISELETFAHNVQIETGQEVSLFEFDATDIPSHDTFYSGLPEKPAGAICAVGYLGSQEKAETFPFHIQDVVDANFTGVASILSVIANDYENRGKGFIVAISSVAGERGRKSNYVYGAAKAGLTAFLSGLRNRLHESNVKVLTVNPGFVDTEMTKGMDLPKSLTASPEEVASDIFTAQQKGKDILYTKWQWRWIMTIIKSIPEGIFKRLSI